MNKIPLILIILTFFGCNQKEKNLNISIVENKTELTEKDKTIFWIDTVSNGKFLKIYSTPENDWQNLTAEYGNTNLTKKIDLIKHQILGIPFTNRIEWITEKSFALVNSCGTSCKYVLIFNISKEEPIIHPIEFYPGIEYADFKTDNPNLYIAVNEDDNNNPSFVIVDTDNQKKDTINLPNDWVRGIGSIFNIIDKIKIENSKIEITQIKENGKNKMMNEIITLK
ncbi:MAG TPA: hypothetical protein ENJ27_00310 [Candidatus Moranbacteria bacterium]|nr:hypothetical protein [Candidatus Moranbacteria bacterium]